MGFRVLRWMGFVRKWQLSSGAPRTSTSTHGLPALWLGHTFCPDTTWGQTDPAEGENETGATPRPRLPRGRAGRRAGRLPSLLKSRAQVRACRRQSRAKLILSAAFARHLSAVKVLHYLQNQAVKMKLSLARGPKRRRRPYATQSQICDERSVQDVLGVHFITSKSFFLNSFTASHRECCLKLIHRLL